MRDDLLPEQQALLVKIQNEKNKETPNKQKIVAWARKMASYDDLTESYLSSGSVRGGGTRRSYESEDKDSNEGFGVAPSPEFTR